MNESKFRNVSNNETREIDRLAFRFNLDAEYQTGGVYPSGMIAFRPRNFTHLDILIRVQKGNAFRAEFPDIFEKYTLPHVSSDKLVQAWAASPMQFWQNQLNFAIWCATTGCGISVNDHLAATDPFMMALYMFHVYYTTRRFIAEIQAPLPQDKAWNALDNPYDRRAYERICGEFGVSPHTDWRRHGINHGLGKVYNYWTNNGYHVVGRGEYDSGSQSFTKATTNDFVHVDYIDQDPGEDWATFILDKSMGFTKPGVERLNDS